MNSTIIKTNSGLEQLDIIIADIESLISYKQDFIAFLIIALGIEFMGSFYDEKDFNEFGQSETRFKNALSNLFKNLWYKNNSDWMFKNFRGPLIHQYRPGDTILLTSFCKNKADSCLHLSSVNGKNIFVLEQLLIDFKLAVQRLKNELKKTSNSLNKGKVNDDFMAIVEINISAQDKIFGDPSFSPLSSGTTRYNPIVKNSRKKTK